MTQPTGQSAVRRTEGPGKPSPGRVKAAKINRLIDWPKRQAWQRPPAPQGVRTGLAYSEAEESDASESCVAYQRPLF